MCLVRQVKLLAEVCGCSTTLSLRWYNIKVASTHSKVGSMLLRLAPSKKIFAIEMCDAACCEAQLLQLHMQAAHRLALHDTPVDPLVLA